MTGCGSAWLERLVWDQEVAGSNPVTPILTNMREWLSWWSATLPRSRPRVRVPSRAFFMQKDIHKDILLHEMSPAGLKQNSENSVRGLRGPKVLFGRCYHWSPGPIAPSRAFLCKGISVRISFFCMKKARNGINVVCSIFLVTTL